MLAETQTTQLEVQGWPRAQTPLIEQSGDSNGPTVTLVAGIGGTAYPGIEACWRLIERLRDEPIHGSIRFVPLADVAGFLDRSSHFCPLDDRALLTAFETDLPAAAESATDGIAGAIANALQDSDFHIELRGGELTESHAHWVAALPSVSSSTDPAQRMAEACSADLKLLVDGAGQWPLQPGTAGTLAARGVPSLVLSTGGKGPELDRDAGILVGDVLRILKSLGVIETVGLPGTGAPRLVGPRTWSHQVARAALWIPATAAEAQVVAGETLGQVRDCFGEPIEDVSAPFDGFVIALTNTLAVSPLDEPDGNPWLGRTVTIAETAPSLGGSNG